MNTASIPRPAKVAPIGARRPAHQHVCEEGDDRPASGNSPMFFAALMAVMSPFIAIGLGLVIAYAIKG